MYNEMDKWKKKIHRVIYVCINCILYNVRFRVSIEYINRVVIKFDKSLKFYIASTHSETNTVNFIQKIYLVGMYVCTCILRQLLILACQS